MAWTCTVNEVDVVNGRARIAFTDGTFAFEEWVGGSTPDAVVANCQARIDGITSRAELSGLNTSVFTLVPSPSADPPQEAVERSAFVSAEMRLRRAKEIVALAGDAGAKLDLASLEADVVATFKAEYLG